MCTRIYEHNYIVCTSKQTYMLCPVLTHTYSVFIHDTNAWISYALTYYTRQKLFT